MGIIDGLIDIAGGVWNVAKVKGTKRSVYK